MSATIIQKLKVIAENKMRSDSATAKIILEAAKILENGNYKEDKKSSALNLYYIRALVDYTNVSVFYSKAEKIIKNASNFYGVPIIEIKFSSYGKFFLLTESIKDRQTIKEFYDSLKTYGFLFL